jgi:hypothetical protein
MRVLGEPCGITTMRQGSEDRGPSQYGCQACCASVVRARTWNPARTARGSSRERADATCRAGRTLPTGSAAFPWAAASASGRSRECFAGRCPSWRQKASRGSTDVQRGAWRGVVRWRIAVESCPHLMRQTPTCLLRRMGRQLRLSHEQDVANAPAIEGKSSN